MARPDWESVELLTPEEASTLFRIPVRTVVRLASRGELQGVRIGKQWRFPRQGIEAILKKQAAVQRRSVLAVDDDVEILSVIRRILKRQGYEVSTCESGKMALELLDQPEKPSLLLLDLLLPDVSGPEILRWMREHKVEVPVLLVTGYPDSELMEQALQFGVCSLLKKPFSPEDLVCAVDLLTSAGEHVPATVNP